MVFSLIKAFYELLSEDHIKRETLNVVSDIKLSIALLLWQQTPFSADW